MRLEELIQRTAEDVRMEEVQKFRQIAVEFYKSIIIFGAGKLAREIISGLMGIGVTPLAICDNNSNIWGDQIDGVTILSPTEAAETYGKKAIFVVSIWNPHHSYNQTERQLKLLGCQKIAPFQLLLWGELPHLLPQFCIDLPSKMMEDHFIILEVEALWADEQSKQIYRDNILWRLSPDIYHAPEPSSGIQYQPTDIFQLNEADVFIDVGAFNGDTIESLMIDNYLIVQKIVAFEPDPSNFEELSEKWSNWNEEIQSRITITDKATGARSDFVKFQGEGKTSSSFNGNGQITVEVTTLDIACKDEKPTIIKLDIEGAELEALVGASDTIKNHQPIICMALYHRQKDIWELPRFIKSINQEYKFYLRQHYYDGFELICYAIPKSRCVE